VRKLVLLEGRKLKVSAAEHALVLLDPQLAVGIRVTMGQYQTCAKFSEASIRKDGVGVFVARSAAAPVDCSNASLFGP
jgi:hypothetical protein